MRVRRRFLVKNYAQISPKHRFVRWSHMTLRTSATHNSFGCSPSCINSAMTFCSETFGLECPFIANNIAHFSSERLQINQTYTRSSWLRFCVVCEQYFWFTGRKPMRHCLRHDSIAVSATAAAGSLCHPFEPEVMKRLRVVFVDAWISHQPDEDDRRLVTGQPSPDPHFSLSFPLPYSILFLFLLLS